MANRLAHSTTNQWCFLETRSHSIRQLGELCIDCDRCFTLDILSYSSKWQFGGRLQLPFLVTCSFFRAPWPRSSYANSDGGPFRSIRESSFCIHHRIHPLRHHNILILLPRLLDAAPSSKSKECIQCHSQECHSVPNYTAPILVTPVRSQQYCGATTGKHFGQPLLLL